MDSSGLPIPIGGSAPLSAVLLELSSRGSKQGNGRSPLQTRDASLASPGPDNTTGQQEQLVLGRGQTGRFSAPNVRQLRNQSTNSKQQESIYENDCQLLLNCVRSSFDQRSNRNQNDPLQLSRKMRHPGATAQVQLAGNQGPLGAMPQHSGQPGTSPQGKHQNQRVLPVYPVSPMAAQAHLNLLRKMENAEPNPGKQPLVEEQQLHGKQPLVERQAEGEALPENPGVSSAYKPGKAAERLNQYMFQQRNRPRDNNIEFWRNLVAEFFAPSATKRYKNIKQIDSLFKAAWNCNMCNAEPCCGFEISQELLPRLHKVKYDTGVSEEHLHIESPTEHEGACGQIFLHYPKAAEESVHDQVRIVHYGQLRVIFSPDLKICSWEFCTQNHEEYIPRSSLIPQVHELGAAVQNYQLSARDSSSVSPEELQKRTDTFVSAAHQMVEALGMPFISQIGIVKRYVRCLQISEVLNIMNDLIDYSQENTLAPKESIVTFPRLGSNGSPGKNSEQEPEQQQSPAASLAPHFGAFVGAGSASGFYGNRLVNTTASTSTGANEHKRQRTGPSGPFAKTPAHTTSLGFITPVFGIEPQVAPTALGKSGPGSTAENVHLEPKTLVSFQQPCHSNLADPNNPPSTVDRIMQEVIAAQPHTGAGGITGVSDAENRIGIMPTGGNALGNYTCVGNSVASNTINYIDAENYESRNNGIGSSAPTIGTSSGAPMDMDRDANLDVFPKDSKGNYLPKEYDDQLLDQFEDFESLHELLK